MFTPVISPTDPPEWEATPPHLGTLGVLLLHMAVGWFQNLEKKTIMNVTNKTIVVCRSEKKHLMAFSYQSHFCPWALKNSLHSQGRGWPPDMIRTPETPASPVDSHFFLNSWEKQKWPHIRDKSSILATESSHGYNQTKPIWERYVYVYHCLAPILTLI